MRVQSKFRSQKKQLIKALKENIRSERKLTRQISRKYEEFQRVMAERQTIKDAIVKYEMQKEAAQLPSVEECLALPESK